MPEAPPPKWRRRLVALLGAVFILASLAFVARGFVQNWDDISGWRPDRATMIGLAALSLLQCAALFVQAEVWHRIVRHTTWVPRNVTYPSFTNTQIARYLPGNVVHLLGRAVMLRRWMDTSDLTRATFIELLTFPISAGLLLALATLTPVASNLAAAVGLPQMLVHPALTIPVAVIVLILSGGFIIRYVSRGRLTPLDLASLISLGVVLLLLTGMVFAGIAVQVGSAPFLLALVAATFAWLVGYATPGAPGGLGTREATLFLLLQGNMEAGTLLIAIALFRLVTLTGDVLCFGIGRVLFRVSPESQAHSQ